MAKVLVVNPYWDTLGGGERYAATFAKLLADLDWSVDIVWPDSAISGQVKSRFNLDLASCRFIHPRPPTINYQLSFWVSDGSLPLSLSRRTIIHLQYPFIGIGGRSLPNWFKSRLYTFVVNSSFTKSFIDREFGVTSQVIYPPIDTAGFTPGRKTNSILYVGRFSNLTQTKGHPVLLTAFSKIAHLIPGWKLILAGGTLVGTDQASFARLTRQVAGLPVEIITNPDFNQLKRLYSQAKIFWSAAGHGHDDRREPTKVEHFGISVVEAMAAGAVPVVTGLGGHKEIVTAGQDGFLWSTPAQLTKFTLRLISHSDQISALSAAARKKSLRFDVSKFSRQFTRLLPS